jgi:drug/metabolite transporter (DMT)-like permease
LTVFLALAGSILFGAADFVGGTTSRRAPPLHVAMLAQAVALVLAVVIAAGASWQRVTMTDVIWSAASGIAAACGLGIFYTNMARGAFSIVVPLTAALAAIVPVAYALARGERPGAAVLIGIGMALAAVVIISIVPSDHLPVRASNVLLAIVTGVFFGMVVICFSLTSGKAGLWPIAVSRTASSLVLVALAVIITGRQATMMATRRLILPACAIGTLEATGVVALLLALHRGPVSVASAVNSLFPLTTVLLAMIFLRERLSRFQLLGVAFAFTSILLISVH